MRKNKMMRAASGLLVATLLTTCVISGTFAKYTTTTSGSDNARVAYWGFNQDADTTIALFADTYTNVDSENGDKVIAPGTDGTSTFKFVYDENNKAKKPEVAYTFKVDAAITGDHSKLDADKSFKWTLQKKGDTSATEYQTADALVAAIKALSGDPSGTKTYNPGELPTAFTAADEEYTVGWKWDFEGQDVKDTELGNEADLENVDLSISITATQID